MRFDPGPGWGGHCIPIDPFYLSWKARQMGIESRFIERAGEVNIGISDFVMDKLETALVKAGKSLAEARVLILGLAYKRNVSDTRESPSFVLIDRLLHAGTTVCYHDPYLPVAPKVRSWPDLPAMACEPLTPETVSACDAVLLVTDHSGVDYELVAENAQLIVDTRGVYRGSRPNLVRA
jgi:UDP-N-acetyl-D-glucosamine dehydrogenase